MTLAARDRDERFALRRERRERVLRLLCAIACGLEFVALTLELRAREGDRALRVAALANGLLIRGDQVTNILPAFREIVERGRREQDVDVAEVAALVRIDESALQRVVMALEGRLRGVELDAVPCEPSFVPAHVFVELAERGRHV